MGIFLKITFPSISPMILASLIYTVIDVFISVDNPVMKQVIQKVQAWEYGYSAAMAWVYFLIVAHSARYSCGHHIQIHILSGRLRGKEEYPYV